MKIVLAPDSFKGTLTSCEVIEILKGAVLDHFPNAEVEGVPVADGGEGTVEALSYAVEAEVEEIRVTGPVGGAVHAKIGYVQDTAILELAQASGLTLVPEDKLDPLLANTYGTGEMIDHVIKRGYRKIIIGIGGSASNDGGTGMLRALGARFYDKEGNELIKTIDCLSEVYHIDTRKMDSMTENIAIEVICDVNNPLLGINGATAVFGRQKGVTDKTMPVLEEAMKHFAGVIDRKKTTEVQAITGGGAAGGTGAALVAFLGAKMRPGIESILDMACFNEKLLGASLVITGEGRIDYQSVMGKALSGIAKRCTERNIPIAALGGSLGEGYEELYSIGIDAIMSCVPRPMEYTIMKKYPHRFVAEAADRLMRLLKTGQNIS